MDATYQETEIADPSPEACDFQESAGFFGGIRARQDEYSWSPGFSLLEQFKTTLNVNLDAALGTTN